MTTTVTSNTEAIKARMRSALQRTLADIADLAVEDIQQSIGEEFPPASSPGSPPHQRTGLLRAGIYHESREVDSGASEAIAASRIGKSGVVSFLERGTSRMAARPFMEPARRRWQQRLVAELPQRLKAEF